jgi:predicted RNA-binding Zn-ribbon protein involved in translation (DUF1610 family)
VSSGDAFAVCVECLGPVPMEGDSTSDDCPSCGSGYWVRREATVADLLRWRREANAVDEASAEGEWAKLGTHPAPETRW